MRSIVTFNSMVLGTLALLAADAGWAQEVCSLGLIRSLDARSATVDPGTLALVSNGMRFASALKDPDGAPDKLAQRSVEVHGAGTPGAYLSFRLGACTDAKLCTTGMSQKAHYHLLASRPRVTLPLPLARKQYFGVRFRVEEPGGMRRATLIAQLWQGAPHTPPFGVFMQPDEGGFRLNVTVANDEIGSNPSAKRVVMGEARNLPLKKWIDMVIEASHDADPAAQKSLLGHLAVSIRPDGAKEWVTFAKYDGAWGYGAANASRCSFGGNCEKHRANRAVDFKFGAYRGVDPEPVSLDVMTVRTADNARAVDPACR